MADDEKLSQTIQSGKYDFSEECWQHVSPAAKSTIQGLLEPNPKKRTTVNALLAAQWVRGDAACGCTDAPLPGSDVQLKASNPAVPILFTLHARSCTLHVARCTYAGNEYRHM